MSFALDRSSSPVHVLSMTRMTKSQGDADFQLAKEELQATKRQRLDQVSSIAQHPSYSDRCPWDQDLEKLAASTESRIVSVVTMAS